MNTIINENTLDKELTVGNEKRKNYKYATVIINKDGSLSEVSCYIHKRKPSLTQVEKFAKSNKRTIKDVCIIKLNSIA